MKNYFKGIIVGIGGISPGLSGSVLLIIFGLYQKTLDALGNFFKNIKENTRFLLPLILGMFTGVLLFSKIINFCMRNYEMPTCFCFLGLILGTLPMIYKEVKKKGFRAKYYLLILFAAAVGFIFFHVNPDVFTQVLNPNLIQSFLLGIAVAATAIIPGVDPAVFLSTLGLYRAYVAALADFDLKILGPMALGLAVGGIIISFCMSVLFKHFYTATYSVIFGIFLSMIPNMLNENCKLGINLNSLISILLLIVGFFISYLLGKREKTND